MTQIADRPVPAAPGLHRHAPGPVAAPHQPVPERAGRGDRRPLRALLVGADFASVSAAWMLVLWGAHHDDWVWVGTRAVPFSVAMGVLTVALVWTQKLYQARVCALRSTEMTRLARVAVLAGLVAFGAGRYGHILEPWLVATAATGGFVAMAVARCAYSGWLRLLRGQGHLGRPVVVVGANDEGEELVHLLRDHPELGYRVVAVMGDGAEWRARIPDLPVLALGSDPAVTVRAAGAAGVVVAASAMTAAGRDRLIGRLMVGGIHVQVSAGLTRIGHNRLRVAPLAHQLTFYVEPPRLSGGQVVLKRVLDVVVASAVLAATAPLIAVSALLIRRHDGGPVLYRQTRVGLGGRTFEVLKLRTMVTDAGQRLAELEALNERQGPLFKVTADPRVTPIGRFLRASSIDELPQLINVLRGEMSMVGPRPALPSEFAQFDADLMERAQVLPGITGLWQVEARDNPSFRVYRRLDLFYVDNWSVAFDLAIMAGTARMLVGRTASAAVAHLRRAEPVAVLPEEPVVAVEPRPA